MRRLAGNIAIGQMGGPTPVINATLVGILKGIERGGFSGKIYMPEGGVRGFVKGKFNVLESLPGEEELSTLSKTPGSDTISSRDKADDTKCEVIFQRCKDLDIKTLFLIGGNDTADNARIISEHAKAKSYDLAVVHAPKTIDCDLRNNDHTPGYASAATAAVNFVSRLNYENRSMGGIDLVVLMGRDSSYLSLATALAKDGPLKAPHLIYPSEVMFDPDRFIDDLRLTMERMKSAGRNGILAVISEGIRVRKDGREILYFQELATQFNLPVEVDGHGNIRLDDLLLAVGLKRLITKNFEGARVTANVPNYLPRCARATVLDHKEATEVGLRAVDAVVSGRISSGTIRIVRLSTDPYAIDYVETEDLSMVARDTKPVPREWINGPGNYASGEFITWAKPLISDDFHGTEIKREILQL